MKESIEDLEAQVAALEQAQGKGKPQQTQTQTTQEQTQPQTSNDPPTEAERKGYLAECHGGESEMSLESYVALKRLLKRLAVSQ